MAECGVIWQGVGAYGIERLGTCGRGWRHVAGVDMGKYVKCQKVEDVDYE